MGSVRWNEPILNYQKKNPIKTGSKKEIVVVCLNNKGIEDDFDVGVEYLAYPDESNNPDLMKVENKLGMVLPFDKDRFKIIVW